METLTLQAYLTKFSASKEEPKHDPASEYAKFRETFRQWEPSALHLREQVLATIRGEGKRPPGPLISLEEAHISSHVEEPSDNSASSLDRVLKTYPDAGFAKVFEAPLDLSFVAQEDSHAAKLYPRLRKDMVVLGRLIQNHRDRWSIEVQRIFEATLDDGNCKLKIPSFCLHSHIDPASAYSDDSHTLETGNLVKATILRVPQSTKEPLELTMKRNNTSLRFESRSHTLGYCTEEKAFESFGFEALTIDDSLRSDGSFANPTSILAMAHYFGIHDYHTLREPLHLQEEDYIDKLKEQQSIIWAEDVASSAFRHYARAHNEKSLSLFHQAIDLNPRCHQAMWGAAMVYGANGDFKRAVRWMDAALHLTHPTPPQHLLDVLKKLNNMHLERYRDPLPISPSFLKYLSPTLPSNHNPPPQQREQHRDHRPSSTSSRDARDSSPSRHSRNGHYRDSERSSQDRTSRYGEQRGYDDRRVNDDRRWFDDRRDSARFDGAEDRFYDRGAGRDHYEDRRGIHDHGRRYHQDRDHGDRRGRYDDRESHHRWERGQDSSRSSRIEDRPYDSRDDRHQYQKGRDTYRRSDDGRGSQNGQDPRTRHDSDSQRDRRDSRGYVDHRDSRDQPSSQNGGWIRPSEQPPHELQGLRLKKPPSFSNGFASSSLGTSSSGQRRDNLNDLIVDTALDTPVSRKRNRPESPDPGSRKSSRYH